MEQNEADQNEGGQEHEEVQQAEAPLLPVNIHPMQTRGKAGIQRPNTCYALLTSKYTAKVPKNIAEAMAHPGWNESVSDEIGTIHMLDTWDLVPASEDMHILSSRWLFTIKFWPDGTVRKLKSRLVVKGYEQEEGLDYLETFSPVVRTTTILLVLNIAVSEGWSLRQLDVTNAFLHGELDEPVYMYQPPGFVDQEKPNHVCKLTKALYGLKQAPRAWFNTFSHFLIDFGFTCSKADPSLFTYHKDDQTLMLLLFVGDILLTGSSVALLESLLQKLNNRFSMKDLVSPDYFLGIEIQRHSEGLFLHQRAYAEDILHQETITSTC